jgi:hypothetical protein
MSASNTTENVPTQNPPPQEPKAPEEENAKNESTQDSEYKLPSRLASYPAVASALETAKEYYNKGKEVAPNVAAYAEKGVQYLAPKVEPILETAKPLLHKADDLSNTALDKVEAQAQHLKTNYEATRDAIGHGVTFAKESYQNALARTSYLSHKAQEDAFAKIQTLSLKTPEEYTLELIRYASATLENGVVSVNQTVSKGLETGSTLIREAPKEVKDRIQTATSDALAAIHTAVEVLSKQFPAEVATKFNTLKEYAAQGEHAPVNLFSTVAENSSKLLNEVGTTISSYVGKGEAIPQQILASSYERLQGVLDSLLTLLQPKGSTQAPEASKEEPAKESSSKEETK